ncbi:MAG TPA: response regulator [Bacteroidota bacterium]|nr:response regulator [Bacteroidota bacterium]
MNGQTPHSPKILANQEMTPRDDTRKIVSEILKRVDQLIKKNNLELAMSEIQSAKHVDPRNVYTLALEERINVLLSAGNKRSNEQPAEHLPSPEPLSVSRSVQSSAAEPPSPHPVVAAAPSTSEEPLPPVNALENYRKILVEAWGHGKITPEKDIYARQVRALWKISDADHERIEREAKHECYKTILSKLSANPAALNGTMGMMDDLKKLYQISDEEHAQMQAQMVVSTRPRKQREKLLVIDDDVRLLDLLAASLEDGGFDVTALSTSDEAYALLRKLTPDLILCDINLETSTMGGFTFYERVQELKHLQNIPFIFLTGLTDEALVRTGKELGVDDYLMKPISEQTLLSTLRGKLKRFRQLRKLSDAPSPALATA